MKKFDYLIIDSLNDEKENAQLLNSLGDEGWELVTIIYNPNSKNKMYLKRIKRKEK